MRRSGSITSMRDNRSLAWLARKGSKNYERKSQGEARQGDDENADNLVIRAPEHARLAINLAMQGVDLLTYSPFNLLCSEESEGNRTSGNSLSKG